MSIIVFYKNLEDGTPETFWQNQLNSFPSIIQQKIILYTNLKERNARIAGKFLLLEQLQYHQLYPTISLTYLTTTNYNKPTLNNSDFQFNISHSENMVVCAGCFGQNIGIDTEFIRPQNLDLFEDYFDKYSWKEIIESKNKSKAFYEKWTSKEAVLKASGFGVEQIDLKSIEVEGKNQLINGINYFTKKLSIDEKYCTYLASDMKIDEVKIIHI